MRSAVLVACGLVALAACGGRGANSPDGEPEVEEKVVVERMPDGSVKKTTIRTTRKKVPASPPPPRPADPWPSDPLIRYNVERVNAYRAQHGREALLYDAKISAFAKAGSEQYASDHKPHAHFMAHAQGAPGFGSRSAENQGDPNGVPQMDPDPKENGKKQIDTMLKMMMDEGPGGGHYENMLNARFRRMGVGILYVGGRMYLTNDFSD
jgi:hypothetical protein